MAGPPRGASPPASPPTALRRQDPPRQGGTRGEAATPQWHNAEEDASCSRSQQLQPQLGVAEEEEGQLGPLAPRTASRRQVPVPPGDTGAGAMRTLRQGGCSGSSRVLLARPLEQPPQARGQVPDAQGSIRSPRASGRCQRPAAATCQPRLAQAPGPALAPPQGHPPPRGCAARAPRTLVGLENGFCSPTRARRGQRPALGTLAPLRGHEERREKLESSLSPGAGLGGSQPSTALPTRPPAPPALLPRRGMQNPQVPPPGATSASQGHLRPLP